MIWHLFIKYFLDELLGNEVLNSHISSVDNTCIDTPMIMYFMFLECPLNGYKMECLFVVVYNMINLYINHQPILYQVH